MKSPYEDIISLPHHVSKSRPRMPMSDRAAQFSPFAALTGYEAAIHETGRLTGEKIELSEDVKESLNRKLQLLEEHPAEAAITFFVPDERKEGGACRTLTGTVRKIDGVERRVILQDGTAVPIDDIIGIDTV